jgi:hypothetical protein
MCRFRVRRGSKLPTGALCAGAEAKGIRVFVSSEHSSSSACLLRMDGAAWSSCLSHSVSRWSLAFSGLSATAKSVCSLLRVADGKFLQQPRAARCTCLALGVGVRETVQEARQRNFGAAAYSSDFAGGCVNDSCPFANPSRFVQNVVRELARNGPGPGNPSGLSILLCFRYGIAGIIGVGATQALYGFGFSGRDVASRYLFTRNRDGAGDDGRHLQRKGASGGSSHYRLVLCYSERSRGRGRFESRARGYASEARRLS